ncbi:hypothetical protein [Acetobacter pasteurianus]|nr:hypothetical protein [Acetobacter pasteurianus]GCD54980.1 hypothetical protein NBRC3222_0317 [Acetobacter pasteurianus NBRC 3222]
MAAGKKILPAKVFSLLEKEKTPPYIRFIIQACFYPITGGAGG